ncbi:MAG: hypothetical protein J5509_05470 [Lachnospiraceae bacterium]|nr:hypothetical protein [Lachnospiraceae bacterium]
MNLTIVQSSPFQAYNPNKFGSDQNHMTGSGSDHGAVSMRKRQSMERQQAKAESGNRIVAQAQSYGQQLKTDRTKAKETALEKKKVQYNYKAISGQLVRCKKSTNASMVASKARREVMRLKRLSRSGQYDEEDIQAALDHAKSMERVAKKKVAHLRQEEMIERTGNSVPAQMEEIEDRKKEDAAEDPEALEEEMADEEIPEGLIEDADYQEQMEIMQAEQVELREAEQMEMAALTEELMAELSEDMNEMLEEAGLDELADSVLVADPNMSEDDLKLLKLKHRTDESKDITKADADYLKYLFDKYEKEKHGASPIASSTGQSGIAGMSSPSAPVSIAQGLAVLGFPTVSTPSVSVDVSI